MEGVSLGDSNCGKEADMEGAEVAGGWRRERGKYWKNRCWRVGEEAAVGEEVVVQP